jgi:hypothetical protein
MAGEEVMYLGFLSLQAIAISGLSIRVDFPVSIDKNLTLLAFVYFSNN